MLSAAGALPSLKPFVIALNSSTVTGVKHDSDFEDTLFIKSSDPSLPDKTTV